MSIEERIRPAVTLMCCYNFPEPRLRVTLEVVLSQSLYASDSLALFCMLMKSAIIRVGFLAVAGSGQTAHCSSVLFFLSLSVWACMCAVFYVSARVCVCVVSENRVSQSNSFR